MSAQDPTTGRADGRRRRSRTATSVPLSKSEQMARVRTAGTAPEMALRRALRQAGLRYRVQPDLPGRPDLAFMAPRIAVFVDGCFWHGHPSKWQPGRFQGYWDAKIKRNMARDARQNAALAAAGWRVVRVWDFEVEHDPEGAARRIVEALDATRADGSC